MLTQSVQLPSRAFPKVQAPSTHFKPTVKDTAFILPTQLICSGTIMLPQKELETTFLFVDNKAAPPAEKEPEEKRSTIKRVPALVLPQKE